MVATGELYRCSFFFDQLRLPLLPLLVCLLLLKPVAYAADITLSDTCSLANAIRSANGDTQVASANECATGDSDVTDTIIFVADVEISGALPAINSDIRIVGYAKVISSPDPGGRTTTEYNFNLLTINSGAVRIENLGLVGVNDSALKIVKNSDDDLEVLFNQGSIGGNEAVTHGGAIYIEGGAEVSIHASKIGDNKAPNGNGGAIYVKNSTLEIKWSNIHDNSAAGNGGAIYFVNDSDHDHKLTVSGSSFRFNNATDKDDDTETDENGGAIYYENAVLTDDAISSLEDNSFHQNFARNGGSVYHANGKLNIDNSTIDESTASAGGGGVYAAGGNLKVRHSTIVKNQAAVGGGIGIFAVEDDSVDAQQVPPPDLGGDNFPDPNAEGEDGVVLTDDEGASEEPEVYIYNSIIAQNTDTDPENSVCLTDLLSGNEGNILEDVGCVEAQSAAVPVRIELVPFGGPNLPRAVINRFYRLLEGSPAIDNGVDSPGQMLGNDQTGHSRPEGQGYDSGSFEFDFEEVWVLPIVTSYPESSNSESSEPVKPNALAHTCVDVHERENGIEIQATFGLESGVQCQEIDASGIGIQWIIDAGFTKAVDIWSYVEQGVQICLDASGPLLLIDATTIPKTVKSINSFIVDGKTCTSLWRPGSIVLQTPQTGASALPAATAQPLPLPSPTPTPQCLATTSAAVNLRDVPSGNRIGGIYPNQTVTVLDSASGWHQVVHSGSTGWISANYLSLSGECNFGAS